MEVTPNFALPNQFLVWVAKKVLAHCDLDLILTDYYKERLEFQLKNRETDTKTPVLTELNESTRLQLPTDWTLYTKPSSLRPSCFPPSPPPSPLSLSSNVILSSATPLTSLFSFRPSSPPLSLHYPSVESCTLEMTSITNETKMTKQGTPTPDSIALTPVVLIPYFMAMPYSGTPSTPFFEGSNVTDFLTRYELMCSDFQMEEKDDLELDFQELLKKTVKIVKLRKKLGGMVKSDKKNNQVSNLVDRCDEEALISSPPNPSAPLPASTFKPSIAVPSSNLVTRSEDTNVKQLTEMMQSLAISVRTIQTYLSQTQVGAAQSSAHIPQYPSNTGSTKPLSSPGFGTGINKCLYCWSREHYLKCDCPAFQENLNNNRIHLNEDKKVCLKTYLPSIQLVYIWQEKSGRDCVADAEKLRYPSLPPLMCKH